MGSGPSAFYAAEELLKRRDVEVTVSMFERLPVAGGLVRFGVAPDHQITKAVERVFARTAGRTGFRAFLGVEVGRDITVDELLEHHHAVIHASGASDDRKLGIPGEELPGSVAAREFVAWYNGHPEYADHTFDLSGRRAVVIGNGNVALDVARILTRDPERLVPGDIAEHALDALRHSALEEVVVLGRRGPDHAAFTTPELLALGSLPEVDVSVHDGYEAPGDASIKLQTIAEYARRIPQPGRRRITLRFHGAPIEVLGGRHVEGLRIAPYDKAGVGEDLECSLVLRSVGHRGRPLPGLPFDAAQGTVPNVAGRVVDPAQDRRVPGVYVAGWIKRGPTGVIGTAPPRRSTRLWPTTRAPSCRGPAGPETSWWGSSRLAAPTRSVSMAGSGSTDTSVPKGVAAAGRARNWSTSMRCSRPPLVRRTIRTCLDKTTDLTSRKRRRPPT